MTGNDWESGDVFQPDTTPETSDVEGVQTGGLNYTDNIDGTRFYPNQEPVETEDDPTPTPEVDAPAE